VDGVPDVFELGIPWEWGFSVPPPLVGVDGLNDAIAFMLDWVAENKLEIHRLLCRARQLYEATGENEFVGHIPVARVSGKPWLEEGALRLEIDLEGVAHSCVLNADLGSWSCSENENPTAWATTRHCAYDYIVEHRDELFDLGFDTSELDRQLRALGTLDGAEPLIMGPPVE
jgi:hypothetical protein